MSIEDLLNHLSVETDQAIYNSLLDSLKEMGKEIDYDIIGLKENKILILNKENNRG